MQSNLMATDLSARSDRVLERAVGLARDRGGELALLGSDVEDLLKVPPCDVLAVKAW